MKNLSKFCTCSDLSCPLHPTNQENGCTPCVAKNLKDREIPSCFFHLVDEDYRGDSHTYTFEDFAALVAAAKGEKK